MNPPPLLEDLALLLGRHPHELDELLVLAGEHEPQVRQAQPDKGCGDRDVG
jgi:hypothetical protein